MIESTREKRLPTETIKGILISHSIPFYEKNGEIFADSMLAHTEMFQYVENVSRWSKRELYVWLGY